MEQSILLRFLLSSIFQLNQTSHNLRPHLKGPFVRTGMAYSYKIFSDGLSLGCSKARMRKK